MANALNRDIAVGEVVIIDPKYVVEEANQDTRFMVNSGFGRLSHTVGRKMFGIWMATGEESMFYGFMISPELTEKYQAEKKKEDANVE